MSNSAIQIATHQKMVQSYLHLDNNWILVNESKAMYFDGVCKAVLRAANVTLQQMAATVVNEITIP